VMILGSVRPKQEFQPSAEIEYLAAKNHRIFGFGRIFGPFTYFRPKVNYLLHTNSKIGQIRTTSLKFDVCLPRFNHYYICHRFSIFFRIFFKKLLFLLSVLVALDEYSDSAEYSSERFGRNHLWSDTNPRHSVEHLYTECSYSQRLFACFERKFTLSEKLSELEKLIWINPLIERCLIVIKRLNILRKQLYDFNHRDNKLRWEMFLNRVDEIYIIEYAIADRSDKLPLHLKIWDSHD
jgi:hypothetical protein